MGWVRPRPDSAGESPQAKLLIHSLGHQFTASVGTHPLPLRTSPLPVGCECE